MSRYKLGPMFLPPVVSKVEGPLAALTIGTTAGGTNWPGGGADPETTSSTRTRATTRSRRSALVEPPPGFSDIKYVAGTAGSAVP